VPNVSEIVAITGGTGFVGRHVIKALQAEGFAVRALVRASRKADGLDGVDLVAGSLEDTGALADLCRGAAAIVHCAGIVSARSREEFDAVNVEGTSRLVGAAIDCAVGRVVLVSSLTAREPTLSPYGASKRAGEHVLREKGAGLSWSILRPPAVYGPGDRGTLPLIRQLTRRLAVVPGSSRSRFSLIFVEDLAQAIVAMVRTGAPAGMIHEVHDGTYDGYSWHELARLASQANGRSVRCLFVPRAVVELLAVGVTAVSRLLGKVPAITTGKVAELYHGDWVCKTNLVEAATDWSARSDFRSGFSATVDWYKARGWL
jgi:nucleoside-diphosphate-sugar epimerase